MIYFKNKMQNLIEFLRIKYSLIISVFFLYFDFIKKKMFLFERITDYFSYRAQHHLSNVSNNVMDH